MVGRHIVVSYRNSTSNHNYRQIVGKAGNVVSYRNSTSNHNRPPFSFEHHWLYLIEILHQTTTGSTAYSLSAGLYLIEILHQTTTETLAEAEHEELYLIEILHQTTTNGPLPEKRLPVVSYRNSTSNHNQVRSTPEHSPVVSYRNSTSNHNVV